MKMNIKNIILLLFISSLVSCSDFLDINDDPNNPTPESIPYLLNLPASQTSLASAFGSSWAIVGGFWSQHWTQSGTANQYNDYDSYAVTNLDFFQQWQEVYAGALNDLQVIRNDAEEAEDWNSYLIATCVQAYGMQTMVDFYDQIPYTEAFLGNEGNTTPMFDGGEFVYSDLINRINDALSKDFSATTNEFVGSNDLLFNGDIKKWKQFANTLKLKMYLRESKKLPNVASSGIAALMTENNFLKEDAAITQFEDLADKSNPLYESNYRQLNVKTNIRASYTFISWLEDNSDTRINAMFNLAPGQTQHRGLAQGESPAGGNIDDANLVSIAALHPTTPFYYFSKEEINFMLAEANVKYGSAALAKMAYDQGVLDSFATWGQDGSSYISTGAVYEYPTTGSQAAQMKAIMMQKWASMVNRGYESFFDQNRTGIPEISSVGAYDSNYVPGQLTYSLAGVTGGLFPRRLIWPDNVRKRNPNTPAEEKLTVTVWWAN